MKHCIQCKKPWGINFPFWFSDQFCTKRCADEFRKHQQQERRIWLYQSWLYSRPP